MYWAPSLSASRVSGNVCVTYTFPTDDAITEGNTGWDVDIVYRESDQAGAIGTWGPRTNITKYSRVTASGTGWIESNCYYDSDDNLHIYWNETPTLENAYTNPEQTWGTNWSSYIRHWRKLGADASDTATSTVHNANWPGGGQATCGFSGFNMKTVGFIQMGECAGRLYCVDDVQ
jgi:hypothetical protein